MPKKGKKMRPKEGRSVNYKKQRTARQLGPSKRQPKAKRRPRSSY